MSSERRRLTAKVRTSRPGAVLSSTYLGAALLALGQDSAQNLDPIEIEIWKTVGNYRKLYELLREFAATFTQEEIEGPKPGRRPIHP